jgi:7-carboxy-7-deazaguanine synthase
MQLIEHYLSIQGEGLHPGKLTYFVRFARCNLSCSWCDSTYTFGKGEEISFAIVANSILGSKARFVCLTGGEPLLHPEDCLRLIRHFPEICFDIETGGALNIAPVQLPNVSLIMDWKLKNSGMSRKMKEEHLRLLRPDKDLLKFVTDGSDEEKTEILSLIFRTENLNFPISIQPVWGTDTKKLTEWVLSLKNPRLQINLQIHKLIWGPIKTGV